MKLVLGKVQERFCKHSKENLSVDHRWISWTVWGNSNIWRWTLLYGVSVCLLVLTSTAG